MKKIKQYKKCPNCGRLYNNTDITYCLNDNYPLIDYQTDDALGEQLETLDPARIHKPSLDDLKKEKQYADPDCVPTCPTCGSEMVEKISTAKRATNMYLFGFFSKTAVSQFKCKNCGYKW